MPFWNPEFMRRALTRWKDLGQTLAGDTQGPGNHITAPFLDTGDIIGGIRYVAQPGHLILEISKDDDTLAATMLELAEDTLKTESIGEISIDQFAQDFELFPSRPGPLLDKFNDLSVLTVNGFTPDVPRLELRYVMADIELRILVLKGRPLRPIDESSNRLRINAGLEPTWRLDAAGMVSFLQAWPKHRILMHNVVEHILGIDHA